MWTVRYTVVGEGEFPTPMLARDHSYPVNDDEAAEMSRSRVARSVRLETRVPARGWLPTHERWESFGWKVIEVEPETKAIRRR